jgi:hypothetical protein
MSINYNVKTVTTTPYTITNDDELIFSAITALSPSSIILPNFTGTGNTGRTYIIKDSAGQSKTNPITITAQSGKTIDGASFAILNTPYSRVWITYDGSNWKTTSI